MIALILIHALLYILLLKVVITYPLFVLKALASVALFIITFCFTAVIKTPVKAMINTLTNKWSRV